MTITAPAVIITSTNVTVTLTVSDGLLTSAITFNAYVTPLMDRYLGQLETRLAPRSLRVMQSNGGCLTAASARPALSSTVPR